MATATKQTRLKRPKGYWEQVIRKAIEKRGQRVTAALQGSPYSSVRCRISAAGVKLGTRLVRHRLRKGDRVEIWVER
jgi:hypothetical protein